jgi:hypothetical protein
MDRLTTVGTLIIYSVRYPKLKVLDMENNNMHSGNAGASSEEMPAWFMRWLNAQQPAFMMPSPPPSTQQPLAVAPTVPSTRVTTNNEGWQITTMPSDHLSFSTTDSLASPAMQETKSPTASTGAGVGMGAPPPISAPTDNLAALSGVLRNLLERPLPAPELRRIEAAKPHEIPTGGRGIRTLFRAQVTTTFGNRGRLPEREREALDRNLPGQLADLRGFQRGLPKDLLVGSTAKGYSLSDFHRALR